MSSLHPSELDSAATDSVASSPRSDHHGSHDPRVRFMCSFGGKILPRPHDNLLRYVGGESRIVAVHRSTTFSTLLTKLSKLSGIVNLSVKYQLPNEDLDALISVTTDEDVENMMEEYDRVLLNMNPRSARLRLFLFATGEDSNSLASSISSLLDGSSNREHWFFDAINSGSRLERGRSEASSIVSEVPDYLFGLDNSDEAVVQPPREPSRLKTRPPLHDNVSASDPGSPAPLFSSSYCWASSAFPIMPSIPDLPPVKTRPDNPEPVIHSKQVSLEGFSETVETPPITQAVGNPNNPVMHYTPNAHYSGPPMQQIPVYYVPGPAPPGNIPAQHVQMRHQYVQQQYPVPAGQMPVGYHQPVPGMNQMYGGMAMRPLTATDPYEGGRMVQDGVGQQVYYGVRNASAGLVQGGFAGAVKPGGEELSRTRSDANSGRIFQSSQ